MKLTNELKAELDALSYRELLRKWRFSSAGDPVFQGESGEYMAQRMSELRSEPGGDARHVADSKAIGWG